MLIMYDNQPKKKLSVRVSLDSNERMMKKRLFKIYMLGNVIHQTKYHILIK
jgi:hypothetical protein